MVLLSLLPSSSAPASSKLGDSDFEPGKGSPWVVLAGACSPPRPGSADPSQCLVGSLAAAGVGEALSGRLTSEAQAGRGRAEGPSALSWRACSACGFLSAGWEMQLIILH